ncbi:myrosinase 1 [Orussus abietinus]|uniref:myrosinase 1 n=1 Tax=Orussus abietinus TaxID=222816 RepID=UPI000626E0A2|nr:myrosinase 1 [Orussus abietinus]
MRTYSGPLVAILVICLPRYCICNNENKTDYLQFPEGFILGAASSAYQIEGAWKVSDKGESQWDYYAHKGNTIYDNSTGDIACDSYYKIKEDVALLKKLGFDTYRFSLSWARILPGGFANKVSKDGLDHYKKVVDELLANGIEPMVTIYHWDHPQVLEEYGGWQNEKMVDWFAQYARLVFREFGDKVKMFATINEPTVICLMGYGMRKHAPGKTLPGIGDYNCVHNLLKGHAAAYRIYDKEFRPAQNGRIGLALNLVAHYPKTMKDILAAEIAHQFKNGWTLHPIFSKKGDYPSTMKTIVGIRSSVGGYPTSRLPKLSQEWIDTIRGSADFLGINQYSGNIVEFGTEGSDPSFIRDQGVIISTDPSWEQSASDWLSIVPESMGDILRKVAKEYNNPVIYITENGLSDLGEIDDDKRIKYYREYLKQMLLAVNRDGVNVKGYYIWSFLDSFEWDRGYSERFGIVSVNFTDPNRRRTLKKSALWWENILRTRRLDS